jgi:serine/threonine protein kinase
MIIVKRIFDPVLTKELREEYDNEVNMLATFRHPHVVSLLCVVRRPPNLCIITEYMHRGSLYHVLHMSDIEMTRER